MHQRWRRLLLAAALLLCAPLAAAQNQVATPNGSVVPYVSTYWNIGGAQTQPHQCGSHVFKHITSATDTLLVEISGSQTIYVCDMEFSANAADNVYLEKATSTSCGGSLTQIGMKWYLTANEGKAAPNPFYRGLNAGSGHGLCVNTSGAVSFDIALYYDEY